MKKLKNNNSRKGMSEIVTTLLVLVLVIVIIGVIWIVVRGIADKGTEQIDLKTKCLESVVKVTKATCDTNGLCNATLSRQSGTDELAGVKLIFVDQAKENSFTYDISGNLEAPNLRTENGEDGSGIATGLTNVTTARAEVYFLDSSGKEVLCTGGSGVNVQRV